MKDSRVQTRVQSSLLDIFQISSLETIASADYFTDVSANCPLCQRSSITAIEGQSDEQGRDVTFFHCAHCDLRFKSAQAHLSPAQEKAHYEFHNNDPEDEDYRRFLLRLAEPLLSRLLANSKGLDFGCGPTKALEKIFVAAGHSCLSYDPYFFPDTSLLQQHRYDFISCSEAAEHFYSPYQDFSRLAKLLKDGGFLAVMTARPPGDFKNWWYTRDPTHVVFYSERSFRFIAEQFGFRDCEFFPHGVVILQK